MSNPLFDLPEIPQLSSSLRLERLLNEYSVSLEEKNVRLQHIDNAFSIIKDALEEIILNTVNENIMFNGNVELIESTNFDSPSLKNIAFVFNKIEVFRAVIDRIPKTIFEEGFEILFTTEYNGKISVWAIGHSIDDENIKPKFISKIEEIQELKKEDVIELLIEGIEQIKYTSHLFE